MSSYLVTNSERSAAACPQRWLLKYGLNLRPQSRSRALDVGSFVHEGLEHMFSAFAGGDWNPLTQAHDAVTALAATEIAMVEGSAVSAPGMFNPMAYSDPRVVSDIREAMVDAKSLLVAYNLHWRNDEFEVVQNEDNLRSPVRSPKTGRRSPVTSFGGKVDKVVKYHGRLYIMEHKTTSLALESWHEKNRRSPQVRGYAWALREQKGIEVEGVIYDLVQSKPPRRWDSLKVLKSGKALAKVAGLPWTTSDEFQQAVNRLPKPADGSSAMSSTDWYWDTFNALQKREQEGFWFRREVELFEPGEIDRIEDELYYDATRIRRWKERTLDHRKAIISADPADVPSLVEMALADCGTEFPRMASLCWQYNRLCSLAPLCGSHSSYDVHGFKIEKSIDGHSELQTTGSL